MTNKIQSHQPSQDNVRVEAPEDAQQRQQRAAPRSKPTCARCQNHGIPQVLRGHKSYCRYRDCPCRLCQLTSKKQSIMAKQIKMRRRRQLERELGYAAPTCPPQ